MIKLPLPKSKDVFGKNVFLRADLDVPLSQPSTINNKQLTIEDDTRLKASLPTIEYLLKHNAKVIIAGHLGRPKGIDKSLSLEPVARWFLKEFKIRNLKFEFKLKIENLKLTKLGGFDGWQIADNLFLLENLRFYPGEEQNDLEFAEKLASLAQVYVNDAFAMCHRKHASIVGVTCFLPHFAGFHLAKEVKTLSHATENPKRPLVVIVGGKKIETKLPLVEKMHRIADYVLVGGKIAQETATLLRIQHEKAPSHGGLLIVADSNEDGSDIVPTDAETFLQIINKAKTIIWNGSMGIIGNEELKIKNEKWGSEAGTRKIVKAIIKSGAYSVVGGGDTVEYLNKLGVLSKFSFASTGGGAMLAFLSGEKLPGIEALINR